MGDQQKWDDCWRVLEPLCDSLLMAIDEAPLPDFHRCSLTACAATYVFGAAIEQRQALGDTRSPWVIARELFGIIIEGIEKGVGEGEAA